MAKGNRKKKREEAESTDTERTEICKKEEGRKRNEKEVEKKDERNKRKLNKDNK